MKTKFLLSVLFSLNFYLLSSQVPQGINYQALAGDASGNPIRNTELQVKISILSDTTLPVTVWEELHPLVKTNAHGIFSLVVGKGTRQPASSVPKFSDISWKTSQLFIRTQVYYQSAWKTMGSAKLWSVPYSLVADNLSGAVGKLSVAGTTSAMDEALFEVKNKNGQTVFAVYNEGVRVYVDDGAKSPKGGFAIGGFDVEKGTSVNYLIISPDSARIYINNASSAKVPKGGFAIGGFDNEKGTAMRDLLTVSDDSIRMYIDNNSKTPKGGFAIGGFDNEKGINKHFLDVSTDATGIVNPSQNRILWYPIKNAFLAGKVLIESPDSVGVNSFSAGFESKARGQFSQAMGYQAISRGTFSTSIGYQSIANKDNSFAFGQWAQARNYESYAFGRGAIAEGFRSFAFGSAGVDSAGMTTGVTYAKGEYSFAIGQGSQALGRGSVALGTADTAYNDFSQAFGLLTKASGHTSTTFGYKTQANDWVDMAIGAETVASGHHSFAGGYGSIANSFSTFAFGQYTLASGVNSVAMGQETKATGNHSIALGYKNQATSQSSTALGHQTIAEGPGSLSGGSLSKASGINSFAFGYKTIANNYQAVAMGTNTIASGGGSFAMGDYSEAKGNDSFAMGDSSIAINSWAFAFGNKTLASDYASLAGGIKTKATGHHSFAFGYGTLASGTGSMALGDETVAASGSAFTIGYKTHANGWGSAVFGNGTIANSYATVVFGRFNDTTAMTNKDWYSDSDAALIVGNGTSNTNRKNALTVLQNSNVGINMVNPQQKLDIAGGNGRVESGFNWLTSSDIRFKKNISTLESSLEKVLNMRGVRFDMVGNEASDDIPGKNIGFIAQELETVVPEVVVTGPDGYKSVAYDKLTAVLTEAIKEQQHKIESQQKEIDELRALVNSIISNQSR